LTEVASTMDEVVEISPAKFSANKRARKQRQGGRRRLEADAEFVEGSTGGSCQMETSLKFAGAIGIPPNDKDRGGQLTTADSNIHGVVEISFMESDIDALQRKRV